MEGLHIWQPEKLYYFTDASHFDFLKGKGPEYSMTETSPSQHVSYARIAANEISLHKTQYGGEPANDIASGNLNFYEQPLTFVLAKSLVGGSVTADVFAGVVPGPIPFAPVHGYLPPQNPPNFSIELGGGWAFYSRFYPAHNLDSMPTLLTPELGVGGGQDFPVPIILHNNSDKDVIFNVDTQLPAGWSIDSNSVQYAHHPLPMHEFLVRARDSFPLVIRLIAPEVSKSVWQDLTWKGRVDGQAIGEVTLKVHVGT